MDFEAFGVSLRLALATSVALTIIGLPIANWLVESKSRGKFLVETFLNLPFVLPPTVLGFFLLVAFSRIGALGFKINFTFTGLLVGSILLNLPIVIQPFVASLSSVNRRLVEASWALGWSKRATFARVVIPLAWPGILAGVTLCFAHTLGEFGLAMMIGGNLRGLTRTVAISIYDNVQEMDLSTAQTTAVVQLVVSFLLLLIMSFLKYRQVNRA
jgi:molybdate transport system permease protein